ncbi:MAG TPA: FAD-dependent oxidoreductase [Thermoanaerobaculia bacterium]
MKVAVAGGGIIGLCTAWYVRERGHEVIVVDRGGVGCSYGNAGMIVPSHFVPLAAPGAIRTALRWMLNRESPFYVKPRLDIDLLRWGWRFHRASTRAHVERAAPLLRDLHLASLRLYQSLAPEELVQRGLLIVCKSAHALHEEAQTAAMASRLGMQAEVVDAAGVAELEPELRMDLAGGVFYPGDAHLDPSRVMGMLAAKLDVERVDAQVTGWRTANGRIAAMRTTSGEIAADEYVVAAGSWSTALVRELGIDLPMQAGKGYSLTMPRPRQQARRGIILAEARVAVTPMGEQLRFGGTMEIAGLHELIDPVRVRGIIRSALRYFPDFEARDFDGIAPWCGLRPCSPDGLPYIGRARGFANLSIATGHAMMGMSLGPVTGKLIAELVSGETPSIDLAQLAPDRYTPRP